MVPIEDLKDLVQVTLDELYGPYTRTRINDKGDIEIYVNGDYKDTITRSEIVRYQGPAAFIKLLKDKVEKS